MHPSLVFSPSFFFGLKISFLLIFFILVFKRIRVLLVKVTFLAHLNSLMGYFSVHENLLSYFKIGY
jgi:hypothetical protein